MKGQKHFTGTYWKILRNKGGFSMLELFSILYVVFIGVFFEEGLPIGYLLVASIAMDIFYLFSLCDKGRKLTDEGKVVFIVALFGTAYAVLTLAGFDVLALFR